MYARSRTAGTAVPGWGEESGILASCRSDIDIAMTQQHRCQRNESFRQYTRTCTWQAIETLIEPGQNTSSENMVPSIMLQYMISVCAPTTSTVCTRTDIARSSSKSTVQTKRILLRSGLASSISGGDVDEIQFHDPCDVKNGEDRASTRLCLLSMQSFLSF